MVDTIKAVSLLNDIPPIVREQKYEIFDLFDDIKFYPIQKKKHIAYRGESKNIRLCIIGDKIFIENSMHVYRHGTNASDFKFGEMKNTIDEINDQLHGILKKSRILKISTGVNISKSGYPFWSTYKAIPVESMRYGNKKYGAKYFLSDYSIKGYDKQTEQKIHYRVKTESPVHRIEKEVKYMRHYNKRSQPIGINVFDDLKNEKKILAMKEDLINNLSKINIITDIDYDRYTSQEIKSYLVMKDNAARNAIKRNSPSTYKRDQEKFKRIMLGNRMNLMNDVIIQVDEKFMELLHS